MDISGIYTVPPVLGETSLMASISSRFIQTLFIGIDPF